MFQTQSNHSGEFAEHVMHALEYFQSHDLRCDHIRMLMTDGGQAVQNAATKFPNACHTLCAWHAYQNLIKGKQSGPTDSFQSEFYKMARFATNEEFKFHFRRVNELAVQISG